MMGSHFSFISILFVVLHLVSAGQQIVSHETNIYHNDDHQIINQQASPRITYQHQTYSSNINQQQEQVPSRWRSLDNQYDSNRDTKLNSKSNLRSNDEFNSNQVSKEHIETKHEELRRRTMRMRTLTTQQNTIRKELETNETMLTEKIKADDQANIQNIKFLVMAIRRCINIWERIQTELQKLYRDQIFEEKKLLELYRVNKPSDRDLHNQLEIAIQRYETVYNQLLGMQLNEKRKNEEREKKFEILLNELKSIEKNSQSFRPYQFPDPSEYAKLNRINNSIIIEKQQQQIYSPSRPFPLLKSSAYTSFDSSDPNLHYITDDNQSKTHGYTVISTPSKTNPDLEENKIIFRKPDSTLKNVKCLDKWFEDLGREDTEWIVKNQLKNEELFRELVKLQKLQWDGLRVEHNKKKQQHLPTFKCDLETEELCRLEEENFNRKFKDYKIDRYPNNVNQQQNQQNQLIYGNQQQNQQNQLIYGNQQQSQQERQPIYNYNYQSYQKIN